MSTKQVYSALIATLVLLIVAIEAQAATVDEIITLSNAGVAETMLIEFVEKTDVVNLRTSDVEKLRNAKVSEVVIKTILQKQKNAFDAFRKSQFLPLQISDTLDTPTVRYLTRLMQINREAFLAINYQTEHRIKDVDPHIEKQAIQLVVLQQTFEKEHVPAALRQQVDLAIARNLALFNVWNKQIFKVSREDFFSEMAYYPGDLNDADLGRRADAESNAAASNARMVGTVGKMFVNAFAWQKRVDDFNKERGEAKSHDAWKKALKEVSAADPGLPKEFLDFPWWTDPSFQFTNMWQVLGEEYPLWCLGEKNTFDPLIFPRSDNYYLFGDTKALDYIGNLRDGPILIQFTIKGTYVKSLKFYHVSGKVNCAVVTVTKGHLGISVSDAWQNSAWSARGLKPSKISMDYAKRYMDPSYWQCIHLSHLPLPKNNCPEDQEAVGEVYMYVEGVHPANPAEVVNLRTVQIGGVSPPECWRPKFEKVKGEFVERTAADYTMHFPEHFDFVPEVPVYLESIQASLAAQPDREEYAKAEMILKELNDNRYKYSSLLNQRKALQALEQLLLLAPSSVWAKELKQEVEVRLRRLEATTQQQPAPPIKVEVKNSLMGSWSGDYIVGNGKKGKMNISIAANGKLDGDGRNETNQFVCVGTVDQLGNAEIKVSKPGRTAIDEIWRGQLSKKDDGKLKGNLKGFNAGGRSLNLTLEFELPAR